MMTKKGNKSKSGLAVHKLPFLFWLGIILSLVFGGIAVLLQVRFSLTELQLNFPEIDFESAEESTQIQSLETRTLTIQYPSQMWFGKEGVLTLNVSEEENGLSAVEDNPPFTVMLEVRPESADIRFDPTGSLASPLLNRETLTLKWKINPNRSYLVGGRVWVYVNLVSEGGSIYRQPLFAVPIEVKVLSLFGVSAQILDKVSIAGLAVGLICLLVSFQIFHQRG